MPFEELKTKTEWIRRRRIDKKKRLISMNRTNLFILLEYNIITIYISNFLILFYVSGVELFIFFGWEEHILE